METEYLKAQMSGILDGLSSTFTTCACGASTRDCALKAMETFVDSSGPLSPHPEGRVDLGPLVGSKRGFKTRERVSGSGGLSGVEMDFEGREEEEEEWDVGEGPSNSSARSNVRDVAAAFRAAQQSPSGSTSSPRRKAPQGLPKLTLSPATSAASPSPRKDRSGKAPRHRMDWKGKGKAWDTFAEDAREGGEWSSRDSDDDRISACLSFGVSLLFIKSYLGPDRDQRRKKRARRSVSIDPSPSSPLRPRSKSHSYFHRTPSPRSPRSPLSGEIDLAEDEGEDVVVVEDKMPPKMRKKWIHDAADALKESLQKGERLDGDEMATAEGGGTGMEIDVERDSVMASEDLAVVGAKIEHEVEDIEMSKKDGEADEDQDVDIEMEEPSGIKILPGTPLHV